VENIGNSGAGPVVRLNVQVPWRRVLTFVTAVILATQAVSILVSTIRGPVRPGDMLEWSLRANVAMVVPGVVALLFARFWVREPARQALGWRLRPNRFWAVAWLLPAVLTAASIGLRLQAPGSELVSKPGPWSVIPLPVPWNALAAGLLAGLTVCLPGALGEELAWRGLLWRELRPLGFWRASAAIGLAWAVWHLPAVILGGYAGGTLAGALGLTAQLLLITPVVLALRERGASVISAALFHASRSGMLGAGSLVKGSNGIFAFLGAYLPLVLCVLVVMVAHGLRSPVRDAAARAPAPDRS
jgi:membrane protease YdiL (CAAX protease family)